MLKFLLLLEILNWYLYYYIMHWCEWSVTRYSVSRETSILRVLLISIHYRAGVRARCPTSCCISFFLEAGRVRWTSRTAVVATAAGTCMFGIIIETIQCMVPAMLASTNVHLSAIAASTAAVDDGIVEQLFLNRFDVHQILKILWLLFYRSQYIHINNLMSFLLEEISKSFSLN